MTTYLPPDHRDAVHAVVGPGIDAPLCGQAPPIELGHNDRIIWSPIFTTDPQRITCSECALRYPVAHPTVTRLTSWEPPLVGMPLPLRYIEVNGYRIPAEMLEQSSIKHDIDKATVTVTFIGVRTLVTDYPHLGVR